MKKIIGNIHAIRIPFRIPLTPEKVIERDVYSYIVFGDEITLIDSGVSGAETIIFDYLKQHGRDPKEISLVILSHSHPDHIGSVKAIQEATRCRIAAHAGEKDWIEDTARQFNERPVPGFHTLVGGPVNVDRLLTDGELVAFGAEIRCKIIHTPGHSPGSISLWFEREKTIISGDSLPVPGDLPIYEDVVALIDSIRKVEKVNARTLLSSWEAPIQGHEQIDKRIRDGSLYLRRIHEAVLKAKGQGKEDIMALCRYVVNELALPPFAANPLVARSFASNLRVIADGSIRFD